MHVVNLEDTLLDRLAQSPPVLAQLPFLRQLTVALQKRGSNCAPCGRTSQDVTSVRNAVKSYLAQADATTVATLKRLLGADQVRMFYGDGSGVKEALL
jgi:hypothetical protein